MSGHAFQVFVGDDELRVALAAIRSALTEGGRFVFETRNPLARAWEHWGREYSGEVTDGAGAVVRVETGQQRSTRRTAPRHVVHLAEHDALTGHRIDIGSLDLRSIAADVRKPHVVSKDQNYVRLGQYSSRRYRALPAQTR